MGKLELSVQMFYYLPSDKNFKRDISDLDLGLNLISKLKPSQYNYKIDDLILKLFTDDKI